MAYWADVTVNPPHYVNVEFDHEWGASRPLEEGVTLDPDLTWIPQSGHFEKPRKKSPDIIKRWEVTLVSERFRDLIEEVSPGVHQFFPFNLRNGPGHDAEALTYFVLNVTVNLEGALAVGSSAKPNHDDDANELPVRGFNTMGYSGLLSAQKLGFYGLALKTEATRGHHLFRSSELGKERLFLSNEVVKRMVKAPKITGLDGGECLEVLDSGL